VDGHCLPAPPACTFTPSAAARPHLQRTVATGICSMVRAAPQTTTLQSLGVGEPIKQYLGQVQVTRGVNVKATQAPGKHL